MTDVDDGDDLLEAIAGPGHGAPSPDWEGEDLRLFLGASTPGSRAKLVEVPCRTLDLYEWATGCGPFLSLILDDSILGLPPGKLFLPPRSQNDEPAAYVVFPESCEQMIPVTLLAFPR